MIDDALKDPELWLTVAADQQSDFCLAGKGKSPGYPGIELHMSTEINDAVAEFFLQHIRHRIHARRLVQTLSRFSMTTLRHDQLRPVHSLCHRDVSGPENLMKAASVLYLFKDSSLGGTSFYAPKKSVEETDELVHDSLHMSSLDFTKKYAIEQRYMQGANTYFEQIGEVAAKWNRIVFYDGNIYHTADIVDAEKLSADPRIGRLTINGFFSCTPKATSTPD
ncbi:MAG: hypothetical protein H7252_07505 [Cytophaga sp.]|nr:hypothetical protein [Undibacterium sp.]